MSGSDAGPATAQAEPARPLDGIRLRFEQLARPHLAHLYKRAVRLTGRTQDAEDRMQRVDPDAAEATVVQMVSAALLEGRAR
jgi:hypothetical protein